MKKISNILRILTIFLSIFILHFLTLTFHQEDIVNKFKDYSYEMKYILTFKPYAKDLKYKKALIRGAKNSDYTLEKLGSIVGPKEFLDIIKEYNSSIVFYCAYKENQKDEYYLKSGDMRANLHIHSTFSDGITKVSDLLQQGVEYANYVNKKYPKLKRPLTLAFTDHNTLEQDRAVLNIIAKDFKKYKNLKVILGIEIFAKLEPNKFADKQMDVHLLGLCVNPFDKVLKKEYLVLSPEDKWHWKYQSFEDVIKLFNKQRWGYVGIAHPLLSAENISDKKEYIRELFRYYEVLSNKPLFVEAYYRPYGSFENEDMNYFISEFAKDLGIIRTGGMNTHGAYVLLP